MPCVPTSASLIHKLREVQATADAYHTTAPDLRGFFGPDGVGVCTPATFTASRRLYMFPEAISVGASMVKHLSGDLRFLDFRWGLTLLVRRI